MHPSKLAVVSASPTVDRFVLAAEKEKAEDVWRGARRLERRECEIVELYEQEIGKQRGDWRSLEGKNVVEKSWWSFSVWGEKSVAPPKSPASFWLNYDISRSLSPNVEDPEVYAAGVKLMAFLKMSLARRKLRRRAAERRQFVKQRESLKIQKAYRKFLAVKVTIAAKEEKKRNDKDSKQYTKFLDDLLEGVKNVQRWSHSKKKLVPCKLRVDGGLNYEHFIFEASALSVKRFYFHDIQAVTKGYASPFLRQFVDPTDPDKTLSIYFRDRRKGGKEISVDLVFKGLVDNNKHIVAASQTNTNKKVSATQLHMKGTSSSSSDKDASTKNDGNEDNKARVDRNRFYDNLTRLVNELESDGAFFFNTLGSYCRVGKSIFERWERVMMLDPDWEKPKKVFSFDDEKKVKERRKRGCYRPLPIDDFAKKPQNAPNLVPMYRWERSSRSNSSLVKHYGAAWYSETLLIDYGDHAKKHVSDDFFRNPMRKEVYTLQRYRKRDDDTWEPEYSASRHHQPASRHHQQPTAGLSMAEAMAEATKASLMGSPSFEDRVPTKVRLTELKPHFAKRVKEIFGVVGVAGWRNCVTSEFDFEDDAWRKLIQVARHRPLPEMYLQQAKKAAKDLEDAMDARDEDDNKGHHHHREKASVLDDAAQKKAEEDCEKKSASLNANDDKLVRLRIQLLKVLYGDDKDHHKPGKMWVSGDETFNTAQKLSRSKDQKKIEDYHRMQKRLDSQQKVLSRSSSSAADNLLSRTRSSLFGVQQSGTINTYFSRRTQQPSIVHEEEKEEKSTDLSFFPGVAARTVADGPKQKKKVKHLSGTRVVVRVNELKVRISLGLKVKKFFDAEPFTIQSRKREEEIVATHAFRIVRTEDKDILPSVDTAYQNFVIRPDDLLVAVNGRVAHSHDELYKLTQEDSHARVLTFFRVLNHNNNLSETDQGDAPYRSSEDYNQHRHSENDDAGLLSI